MFAYWLPWAVIIIIIGGWLVIALAVSLLLGRLIRNADRGDEPIPVALACHRPVASDTKSRLTAAATPRSSAPSWRGAA